MTDRIRNVIFGTVTSTVAMTLFLISGAGHVIVANIMQ